MSNHFEKPDNKLSVDNCDVGSELQQYLDEHPEYHSFVKELLKEHQAKLDEAKSLDQAETSSQAAYRIVRKDLKQRRIDYLESKRLSDFRREQAYAIKTMYSFDEMPEEMREKVERAFRHSKVDLDKYQSAITLNELGRPLPSSSEAEQHARVTLEKNLLLAFAQDALHECVVNDARSNSEAADFLKKTHYNKNLREALIDHVTNGTTHEGIENLEQRFKAVWDYAMELPKTKKLEFTMAENGAAYNARVPDIGQIINNELHRIDLNIPEQIYYEQGNRGKQALQLPAADDAMVIDKQMAESLPDKSSNDSRGFAHTILELREKEERAPKYR